MGVHPESGNKIQAGLGRFGPYIVHKKGGEDGKDDYRSIRASSEDDVLTIPLERALEMLAEPKRGRGRRGSKKKPMRELGDHPTDKEPLNIYDGPYGPYIKYKRKNISIPDGDSAEELTLERAVELIAAKSSSRKTSTAKRKTTSKKTSTAKRKTTSKKTSNSDS